MAESVENSSSEESEISDFYDVSSADLSTSSTSSSEEESISNRAKGKTAAAKKTKTTKGNASSANAKTARPRKKKKADNSLNANEMEDLSTWICSSEEVNKVEQNLRLNLVKDARINKGDRKRLVEHLLCDTEKQNFGLLMNGFCRKFSTLAQEAYNSNIATYRKAAFSIAWMKFLSNFHPGKITQERMIVERLLKSSNEVFDAHCVHGVLSVLHESVYLAIHDHVRIKKAETESTGTYKARSQLCEESEDTLYRYCGASLHRMIKLREETLAGKKGRAELSDERKPVMTKELQILRELVMKDKSNIPESLKTLDEGNLKFPRTELLSFLRSVDNEVREFATDSNLRKYPSKFLTMCQNAVLNNETLEMDFRLIVAAIVEAEVASDAKIVNGLYHALVSKLANTRINEFMNARMERELKTQGKVVDADEMLRPRLKAYAVATKRK